MYAHVQNSDPKMQKNIGFVHARFCTFYMFRVMHFVINSLALFY